MFNVQCGVSKMLGELADKYYVSLEKGGYCPVWKTDSLYCLMRSSRKQSKCHDFYFKSKFCETDDNTRY